MTQQCITRTVECVYAKGPELTAQGHIVIEVDLLHAPSAKISMLMYRHYPRERR
jgi:hypothetical protein